MTIYRKPNSRVHRGFAYLNDETVVNSLSAVEAGKVDEVVAKVNSSRDGGFGGGVGIQGAKLEGSRKSTSAFEEEMIRTRTRFSVFEAWRHNLETSKAIGSFNGWGETALEGVASGDTIEFRAELRLAPVQIIFRLFLWFADRAKAQGNPFSQKGDDLKQTKEGERNIRMFLGDYEGREGEMVVLASPVGDAGPVVAMTIDAKWLLTSIGQLGGEYTVMAQVDRVLGEGEEVAALRLTRSVPETSMEVDTLKRAIAEFASAAGALGIEVSQSDAVVIGPALLVEPVAIFR